MLTILVLHNHIDVLHWQSKEEQEQLALLLSFFHCKKVNRTIIIQHLGRYLVAETELKTEQFVLKNLVYIHFIKSTRTLISLFLVITCFPHNSSVSYLVHQLINASFILVLESLQNLESLKFLKSPQILESPLTWISWTILNYESPNR